jgi:hypothetical protein
MAVRRQARQRVTSAHSSTDDTAQRRSPDGVRSRRLSRQCGLWPPNRKSGWMLARTERCQCESAQRQTSLPVRQSRGHH